MDLRTKAFAGEPLGVPVIDAHTHILGDSNMGWYQAVRSTADAVGLMDHLGFDAIVTAPHSMIFGDMEFTNEQAAAAARAFPGRIYGHITICPQRGLDAVRRTLEACARNPAFVGIKLLPGYHGPLACPEYDYVLDFAAEARCPVLTHIWSNSPPLTQVERAVQTRPGLKLMLAHQGGGTAECTDAATQLMRQYPNLCLEICGSLYNRYSMEEIVGLAGADRVIFGTDMINLDPRFDFGRVALSTLPDEIKRKILAENFLRLLADSALGKIRLPPPRPAADL